MSDDHKVGVLVTIMVTIVTIILSIIIGYGTIQGDIRKDNLRSQHIEACEVIKDPAALTLCIQGA